MSPITESLTRATDGREVPVAGIYFLDAAHTSVEFVARHLMITKVRGRLPGVSGTITIGDRPEDSHTEVEVVVATLDTGVAQRDHHLRSSDFFDADRHPVLTFKSTEVRPEHSGKWAVVGDLTIRGVTRTVTLDATFEGAASPAPGDERIAFSASAEVDREEWGLTWNEALETGGVLVGRLVRIELEVEAVRTHPA